MKKISLLLLTCCFTHILSAQTPSLSQLFYPNLSLRAEFMPTTTMSNGQKFGFSRNTALGIIPLSTEIQAGIGFGKKADIQAKHSLLIANLAQINTTIDGREQPEGGYKTLGMTFVQLKASLREKFWVYAVGGGITQTNETFLNPQPYFYGGAARLRILGLRTQILYGTAIVYSQKFRIIPVFGFTKALGNDWKVSGVLPFRASLTYKAEPWLHLDLNTVYDGYSAGYQEYSTAEKLIRRQNYQQVRFTVSANAHVLNVFNLGIEGGLAGFRQVKTFNSANENLSTSSLPAAPYLGFSIRYITSKSKLSSKFLKQTGIDF
ncbi:hypothetical protein [Arcicella rigui]|uniref:Outer membrane protein beta-barrel domain-containing protein n=1 Tax=Arcicella rigui TaxID=797020 RepID=A0ABU5QD06_9BACT|nr:hypothetical protein [Arcicella rigui]MEA5140711.1 hypothetical protein [Arcicella rigui]